MVAEKHIRHYNRLNGNSVSKATLKKFLSDLEKDIHSKRIDSHVPFGVECIDIAKRIRNFIKRMGDNDVVGKVILKPIPINRYTVSPSHQKKTSLALDGVEVEKEMTFGLEKNPVHAKDASLGFTKDGQNKIYDMITDMILKVMKSEKKLPWRQPWEIKSILATNYATKTVYKGANLFLLNLIAPIFFGKRGPYWLTFNQVKNLNGRVKKGAEAFPVIYYREYYVVTIPERKTITEAEFKKLTQKEIVEKGVRSLYTINYYNVFAQEDIEGIKFPKLEARSVEPIESAEAIVDAMPQRPKINVHNRLEAYYNLDTDEVTMPEMKLFRGDQQYYSTLFHELIHSTGAKNRLNRFDENDERFDNDTEKSYAFEELIAEMGASYLNAEAGILYFTLKNAAAYIRGWQTRLESLMESDNKFFLKASAKAAQAADFILNVSKPKSENDTKNLRPPAKRFKSGNKKNAQIDLRKLRHYIEGYLSIEKEIEKVKADLNNYTPTPEEYEEAGRKVENFNDQLEIQVKRAAQALGISEYEFIGRVNNYTENQKSLKDQIPQERKNVAKGTPQAITNKNSNRNKSGVPATASGSISGVPYTYHQIDLGPYKKDFDRVFSDNIIQVHGLPGHGKTVYLLKFGKHLSQKLNVLYVAREEYGRSVFDMKLKEHNIVPSQIRFRRTLEPEDMEWANVIFADSVQALKLTHSDVEDLYFQYPNKIWILVLQSTKDGNFRGSQEWEHLVDIAGEIHNRTLILRKNRNDPNNKEKAEKLRIKDLVTEKKKAQQIKEMVKKGTEVEPKKVES